MVARVLKNRIGKVNNSPFYKLLVNEFANKGEDESSEDSNSDDEDFRPGLAVPDWAGPVRLATNTEAAVKEALPPSITHVRCGMHTLQACVHHNCNIILP